MSADPNRLERRGAQRFEVHSPLAVHFEGRTVPGFIQDLSGRGIFFYAETSLPNGAAVELTFTMPSEITLGRKHARPLSRTRAARFLVPDWSTKRNRGATRFLSNTCPQMNPSLSSSSFRGRRSGGSSSAIPR